MDASADGYGRAEAIVALIVNRGDPSDVGTGSDALLMGSAVNQDGRSSSLTAPHGPSQSVLVGTALSEAGMLAEDVHQVVMHGTGTALGDPIEVGALG